MNIPELPTSSRFRSRGRQNARRRVAIARARWADGSCRPSTRAQGTPGRVESWALGVVLVVVAVTSACAAKTAPPPLPATLKYAEFVYPAVPESLRSSPVAAGIERGWRFLQNDDTANAQKEFEDALKQSRTFYPARAGEAYVSLARREYDK